MLLDKSALVAFFLLQKLSLILPKSLKILIAKFLGFLFYKFHKKYYKIAKINLDFVYKETISQEEKEKIIKGMFFNLASNLGSFIENQGITKDKLLQKVTFKNEKFLFTALKSNQPIVFITAHFSNWEILPLCISAKYVPLTGVGRPLDQPWLDKILKRNREQFGIEMISKRGAMRQMVKAVRSKKTLGLLVDQSLAGEIVDFFGKKVSHTSAAAILAYKYNAIVIPCFIHRVSFEKYEATFYEPIEVDRNLEYEKYILTHTQKQAKITEEIIKKSPKEWLWIHRRWKKVYPEIYN